MKPNSSVVTNHLKSLLAEKKLTHSWLARQMGVHPKLIAAWCENSRQPKLDGICGILFSLEIKIDQLFSKEESEKGSE